jgi:hypothetical protein
MRRFQIHQLVGFEYGEVLAWYTALSPLAADNFVASFHAALNRVELHPTSHAPWRPPFRRVRLVRFPYLLLFHVDRQATSVLALVHERREPVTTFADLAKRKRGWGGR